MKITNYLIILTLTSLLLIILSCEKMIDVEVPQNELSAEIVFQDVQTANAALAGLYSKLRDNAPLAGDKLGPLMGIYTDDLDYYSTATANDRMDLYENKQIPTNTAVASFWTNAYQIIYLANSIIESVEKSPLSISEKERVKGEALLARSIVYFYLQQIFGDIPYVTSTDYQLNQSLAKTSSEQVLIILTSDLASCIGLLKDEYRSEERIYLNKKSAELMLAKVRMLRQQYNEAEVLLKNILNSPLYQFQPNLSMVFDKSGKHILWQLKPQTGGVTKEASIYYFTNIAPYTYALSSDLVNIFTSGDLRKSSWISTSTYSGNTWYRSSKYKNITTNTSEYSIVFRIEEVYLLLSEALTQQNKLSEALQYLNPIKQRAGLSAITVSISQAQLLNEILRENRKEFFCEMGHRFLDLKRLDRLSDLASTKPNWKSFHDLWPLPQKELLLNPNMNPQNPGY